MKERERNNAQLTFYYLKGQKNNVLFYCKRSMFIIVVMLFLNFKKNSN